MGHTSTRAQTNGVALLTVDRPPANAMDLALLEEIVASVQRLADEPPRALVLAGRAGFFSAGVDLKLEPTYGPEDRRRLVAAINAMALGVYELPFPVVGAITGHAVAGGLVLALCTDLRVASSSGRYGLTEVQVGIAYPQAAIGVVRAELAPHATRRLALGAELSSAGECLHLGVFDELAEPDEVLPRALELATGLAAFPPEVYARTKRELRSDTAARLRAAAAEDPLLEI
ncbi:MAG: enoyl-CoA hydratase/isomerase family protein [Solirubrobacteraceae bacterium]